MSEINSNEKKNTSEKVNRGGGNAPAPENRRNQNNNHRRYHQRRPYPRNNDKVQGGSQDDKSASKSALDVKPENGASNTGDFSGGAKKNVPAHVKNLSKKSSENSGEGTKDFQRRNSRHGGFDKRKNQNVRVEETIQDIDIDIGRIEKEIELEIKEIAAFKFGL